MLSGVICLRTLPVAEYPEVSPPTIVCFTSYPGASATEVQDTVAMPLEAQFNGLEDMLYFSSSCTNSGICF